MARDSSRLEFFVDRGSSALIRLHAFLRGNLFGSRVFDFLHVSGILKNFLESSTFASLSSIEFSHRKSRRFVFSLSTRSCYYFAIKSSSIVNWFIENIFTFPMSLMRGRKWNFSLRSTHSPFSFSCGATLTLYNSYLFSNSITLVIGYDFTIAARFTQHSSLWTFNSLETWFCSLNCRRLFEVQGSGRNSTLIGRTFTLWDKMRKRSRKNMKRVLILLFVAIQCVQFLSFQQPILHGI